MPISALYFNWRWAYGGGSGISATVDMNFGPSNAVAQTSLSMASGGGLCVVGITSYRVRPEPNGAEREVSFGWDPNFGFPPSVYDPHMTSVTAQLNVGAHQQGVATLTVFFFF